MMVDVKRKLLSIKDILNASGGKGGEVFRSVSSIDRTGMESIHVDSVSIDSRTVKPGALFVPLKGENTDGHKFLRDAAEKGAVLSFAGKEYWRSHRDTLKSIADDSGIVFFIVEDPLTALQQTAEHYLNRYSFVRRVGITGSSGKTTTKELIGALLSEKGAASVSKGNLNSEIGICLAAFEVDDAKKFAVFELGMNRIGEMDILTRIVKPDVAVITNVGSAHIGFLGSLENIALEKKKIFSLFSEEGVGFVYEEEPFFDLLASDVKGSIRPYGPKTLDGFEYARNIGLDGMILGWRGYEIHLALPGDIQINNACGAIAVALHFDVEEESIASGLEKVKPLFGRGEIRRGFVNMICDYYNANPESMREALSFLHSLETEGRKIVLLGDMKELGDYSPQAHREVGEELLSKPVDLIFLIGEEMKGVYDLISSTFRERVFWADNPDDLAGELKIKLKKGDTLLLKGSRAAALEEIEKRL
jgi:UDP-N-acetylmuramoyl-tripeptide--D-alanyl-D-alanine ligase